MTRKIKWLVDGDENSRFFHGSLKNSNRKNKIHDLAVNGSGMCDPKLIKQEAFLFFSNKFKDRWPSRPPLIYPLFKQLSLQNQRSLELLILIDEIKNTVWCCGNDKAPEPDGLTFKIIKDNWDLMSGDIVNFYRHFEHHASLASGCNSTFITLIPKVTYPFTLSDYRPISLIGCMYKIVAKILAVRLKSVIGSVVSEAQFAFIPRRNILDGSLVINELFSWAKQFKQKIFLFKTDFEKAFDC